MFLRQQRTGMTNDTNLSDTHSCEAGRSYARIRGTQETKSGEYTDSGCYTFPVSSIFGMELQVAGFIS